MALNTSVRRFVLAVSFVFTTISGFAQDTLTLGNGSSCIVVPPGTTSVIVPVHIRDIAGTLLGRDKPAGYKLQAFSFEVLPQPASAIAKDALGKVKISITQAGLTSALPALSSSSGKTATSAGFSLQFEEYDPLLFNQSAPAPGDLVANLTVTLASGLPSGTRIQFILSGDESVTQVANQHGTQMESLPRTTLQVVEACVEVTSSLVGSPLMSASMTTVDPLVERSIADTGTADVMVAFVALSPGGRLQQRTSVLQQIPADAILLRHEFDTGGFAARITRKALDEIRRNPHVKRVGPDPQLSPASCGAASAMHVPEVGEGSTSNLTGSGIRVAIVDTGISHSHPAVSGTIFAEGCLHSTCIQSGEAPPCSTRNPTPSGLVPCSSTPAGEDVWGHGTLVAGMLASQSYCEVEPAQAVHPIVPGPESRGVAPGVDLISVRVAGIVGGNLDVRVSDVVRALRWLRTHHSSLRTNVVNLSLNLFTPGAGGVENEVQYENGCDAAFPDLSEAIASLLQAGVTVYSSSGNHGSATAISVPACINGVEGVAATYDRDYAGRQPSSGLFDNDNHGIPANCFDAVATRNTVTCFSNTNPTVRLAAPGAWISAPAYLNYLRPGDIRFTDRAGTSFASPAAASVAALTMQALARDGKSLSDCRIVGELAYHMKSGSLLNGGREVSRGANRMTAVDALASVLSTQAQGEQGDANGDGLLQSGDVFYLINHLFAAGAPPRTYAGGDANCGFTCDGISSSDIFYLINYLFTGGPSPASACGP